MGHDHGHVDMRAGARHAQKLWWSFALILAFLGVQVVTCLVTGSLALLSDAGHMATAALGLGMALAAIGAANRATHAAHRTFGRFRLEILAALANAGLLFGVAIYVLVEAVGRLNDPPEIASAPVFIVGVLGLLVNLIAFALLRAGAEESLNVRGAYLEVVADTLGSIGVIVAATVMWLTGWVWVDPVIGATIGVFILPRAWKLGRSALRILMQAAPEGLDAADVTTSLSAIEGVATFMTSTSGLSPAAWTSSPLTWQSLHLPRPSKCSIPPGPCSPTVSTSPMRRFRLKRPAIRTATR
jgi:cobalt-zinc-cadmium efflux system protein